MYISAVSNFVFLYVVPRYTVFLQKPNDLALLLPRGNIAPSLLRNLRARPYFLAASFSYLSEKNPSRDSHREPSRAQDLKYTRNEHTMAPVNGHSKRSSKMHSKVVSICDV